MISSAEIDLIRRDPAIPGLATVLDPEVLAAALRRAAPTAVHTIAEWPAR